ncbi:hypothetical protein BGX21_002653 [Mortierella sp. AD011]|nr:hypothetical protein BGX20_000562 [Mortierella sp. AD010]KAF9401118.1 hypothetical protein BGX21_002653 [Mortierella sp. AD011]
MQVPSILEKQPAFSNLIADINARFLTPTGLSSEYDRELRQARYDLNNKKSYLETKTLYEAIDRLRFLPLDKHHETASPPLSQRDADLQQQIATHVDHIICILEMRRLVVGANKSSASNNNNNTASPLRSGKEAPSSRNHYETAAGAMKAPVVTSVLKVLADMDVGMGDPSNEQDQSTHGLDLDDFMLSQLQPHLHALEGFEEPMTEAIQKTIQQRAQDVVNIFNSNNYSNSYSRSAPQLKSLSDVVSDVRKQFEFLDHIKEETVSKETAVQSKTEALFDTLHQSIVVIWEIVVEFMVQHQLVEDQTFKDYFAQMVESVVLKLEILRVSLQESVYNEDTVAQLTKARDILDQKHQALASQTQQNSALLHQYQSAGREFNMIVDAYADIMQRIEVVQDDIRRLR